VFDHKLQENKWRMANGEWRMAIELDWLNAIVKSVTPALKNEGHNDRPCCGDRHMGVGVNEIILSDSGNGHDTTSNQEH